MAELTPGSRVRVAYEAEYVETQSSGAILVRVTGGINEHWYSVVPLHAKVEAAAEARPATCPTLCDEDCGEACHEAHAVSWKRSHEPDDCPGVRRARHWLFGGTLLLAPFPEPLPSMDETMQQVIDDLAERGIRLVVPGFDTPSEPSWPVLPPGVEMSTVEARTRP